MNRGSILKIIATVCLGACVLSACGSPKTLRATSNAIRFSTHEAAPGSSVAEAARRFDETIANWQQAKGRLDAIANSPEPLGKALVDAMCTGFSQVAKPPEDAKPPSNDDWSAFLEEQVTILSTEAASFKSQIKGFVTAAHLAQINPQGARIYLRACVQTELEDMIN